jgi:hypothetical protein
MIYRRNNSLTSSDTYGAGLVVGAENADPELCGDREIIFALPLLELGVVSCAVYFTGGNGRKYKIYALASREVTAAIDGSTVLIPNNRGMYRKIGASGRTSRTLV